MKIERIDENNYERIFLTSDIHGHYSMFEKLLDTINLTKRDLLIILGDSCDRGSQSYEMYKKYYELEKEGYNIKHLRGNHEDMLIKAMESGDNDHWYRNGGEKTQVQQQLVPLETRGVRGAEAVNQIGERLEGVIGKPQRHQDVDCAALTRILCNQRTEKVEIFEKAQDGQRDGNADPQPETARTFAIGTEQFAQKVHA